MYTILLKLKQTNNKELWRNRLVRSVSFPKVWSSIPGIGGVFGKKLKDRFRLKFYTSFDKLLSCKLCLVIFVNNIVLLSIEPIYSLLSLHGIMLFSINETDQNKLFAKLTVVLAGIKFHYCDHRGVPAGVFSFRPQRCSRCRSFTVGCCVLS